MVLPEHQDKKKQSNKDYYQQNKEKILTRIRKYRETEEYKKYHAQRCLDRILATILSKCKKEGINFNLEKEKLVIPSHCPYLGCELTQILGQGYQPTNISIDRINPEGGYTHDNVEIVSRKANTMKQNASREELIIFAENVLKRFK